MSGPGPFDKIGAYLAGLGLAPSRRLCDVMGIIVGVESPSGRWGMSTCSRFPTFQSLARCIGGEPEAGPIVLGTATVLVGLLHAVSFGLPTIDDGNQHVGFPKALPADGANLVAYDRVLRGWEVFLQVPFKLPFSMGFMPAWFANFLLWFGLIRFARGDRNGAVKLGRWCAALAFSAWLVSRTHEPWMTLLLGYYVWLGSMLAFLAFATVLRPTLVPRASVAEPRGPQPLDQDPLGPSRSANPSPSV